MLRRALCHHVHGALETRPCVGQQLNLSLSRFFRHDHQGSGKRNDLYAGMMEEIKLRISSIEYATSGLLHFHPVIIREFAYLQLRMICELIALGCLVAHGDVPATKSKMLSKVWQADEILKRLASHDRGLVGTDVGELDRPRRSTA